MPSLVPTCDGDTSYLALISSEDFNDSTDLGSSNIRNSKLVDEVNKVDLFTNIWGYFNW